MALNANTPFERLSSSFVAGETGGLPRQRSPCLEKCYRVARATGCERLERRSTLDELAALSAKAASVPRDAIPAVIAELERVKTILVVRLITPQPEGQSRDGEWITVETSFLRAGSTIMRGKLLGAR